MGEMEAQRMQVTTPKFTIYQYLAFYIQPQT